MAQFSLRCDRRKVASATSQHPNQREAAHHWAVTGGLEGADAMRHAAMAATPKEHSRSAGAVARMDKVVRANVSGGRVVRDCGKF
jgi:hypothetical protein